MNTLLAWAIGIVVYAALMWIFLAVIRLNKTRDEQAMDDMEQTVAVSKPAPLELPHVRAGTAYGVEVSK